MSGLTPFVADTVSATGVDPYETYQGGYRWWLGNPGQMWQLPAPDPDNYSMPGSRGEVEHGLFGGGAAVTMFDSMTRRWSLAWSAGALSGRDYQVLNALYRQLGISQPYTYVPPEDVNRLTLAQSMCGLLHGSVEGWAATVGTVAYDSTVTSPVPPCGVLRWSGAGSGSLLVAGAVDAGVPTPDPLVSAPYLPSVPVTFSCWVSTASSTAAVVLRLSGRAADGTIGTEVSASSVTASTTPQLLSVTAAPGGLGTSTYVMPEVRCGTGSAPNLLISAPQLSYTAGPADFEAGGGVPRVVITSGLGRAMSTGMRSSAALTLIEAVAGAA